jgi:hypothetical protein
LVIAPFTSKRDIGVVLLTPTKPLFKIVNRSIPTPAGFVKKRNQPAPFLLFCNLKKKSGSLAKEPV